MICEGVSYCSLKDWKEAIAIIASVKKMLKGFVDSSSFVVIIGTDCGYPEDQSVDESQCDSWWVTGVWWNIEVVVQLFFK